MEVNRTLLQEVSILHQMAALLQHEPGAELVRTVGMLPSVIGGAVHRKERACAVNIEDAGLFAAFG